MYTIQQIREKHNMNFCGRQEYKGINYTSDPSTLVLIHTNKSPYDDDYDGDVLYYDGEGLPEKGDQRMSGANKKLRDFGGHCHVYWEDDETKGEFEYLGKFIVHDVVNVMNGDRLVYRFELHKVLSSYKRGWCTIQ